MAALDDEPWRLGVAGLGALLAARAISPVEVLELALARIARVNPTLNAIVSQDTDGARAAARESEGRLMRGEGRGPLEGIALTVKDNIAVRGLPATWGSRLYRDFVPEHDELPVARLRSAGAVILGKTNVPEFTLEGYTANEVFGVTRNPWNTELTPGGSSGGAVASVAAGLTAAAIGTDGGGSIRRPASHTGLVGMKPSTGVVARDRGLPQILLDMEVVGPVARSVEDVRLVLNAMAGPARRDRKSVLARGAGTPHTPLRVLYVPRFGANPLDPEIAVSCAAAARALEGLGCRIEEGQLPFDIEPLNARWPMFGQVGVAYLLDLDPGGEHLVGAKFAEMADQGRQVPAHRYLAAIELLDAFRRTVRDAFELWDVIMTPSAAALPWPAAQAFPAEIDGREVGPRGHAVYTGWVNACGHPGISVPAAPSGAGLPIGFQLVADFGADALLFDLARRYEAVCPWASRWPTLAAG